MRDHEQGPSTTSASSTEPTPDAVGELVCIAKGCRAAASHGLAWNNPKLHTPDRRKVWLACPDHLDHLSNFLQLRGFLKVVVAAEDLPRLPPSPESTP